MSNSNHIERSKLFEKELAKDARRRLIERLERAIELVKLDAPEFIIDMHMHLVNGSAAALQNIRNLAPHLIEAAKQEPPHAKP